MPRKPILREFKGQQRTLKEIAAMSGIKVSTLTDRLYSQRQTLEQATTSPVLSQSQKGAIAARNPNSKMRLPGSW